MSFPGFSSPSSYKTGLCLQDHFIPFIPKPKQIRKIERKKKKIRLTGVTGTKQGYGIRENKPGNSSETRKKREKKTPVA